MSCRRHRFAKDNCSIVKDDMYTHTMEKEHSLKYERMRNLRHLKLSASDWSKINERTKNKISISLFRLIMNMRIY